MSQKKVQGTNKKFQKSLKSKIRILPYNYCPLIFLEMLLNTYHDIHIHTYIHDTHTYDMDDV